MKDKIEGGPQHGSNLATGRNKMKMQFATVVALMFGGALITNADAQCCGLDYSMLSGGGGVGTNYTNVFSPNNGWTKDTKVYQLGRQGQTGLFRAQAGIELADGGQTSVDKSRSYEGLFPKVYFGIGLGFTPAESTFIPYMLLNGGVGASLLTNGTNNGTPLISPQKRFFAEAGGGLEWNIAERFKLFGEGKYTLVSGDNLDGIKLDDGRKDATFTVIGGVRVIVN